MRFLRPALAGRTGFPQQPCGGCLGGCRKIHCPHCGYANPVVAGWFRRRRKKAVTKEKQDDPIE
jgi:hypothetical protein